jgi:cytidyltransferase-like protein
MRTKIVIATGGFDPIHSGHIGYLDAARRLGDMLVVGLNSDAWLARKKGQAFMPIEERRAIVSSLRQVDYVLGEYDDSDGSSCDAIRRVMRLWPDADVVFANGGDRGSTNTPEQAMLEEYPQLEFAYGVGGDTKVNSSSWILQEWKTPKTARSWGYYRVLHQDGKGVKVKELTVDPGQTLSMQRHARRSEFWFVAHGAATVYTLDTSSDIDLIGHYTVNDHLWIRRNQWHQLANETNEPLRLIEIQYGEDCVEDDITRL